MTASETVGCSGPLGATVSPGGVNFSVFSRSASGVTLLLFGWGRRRASRPDTRSIPPLNRTYYYWHASVDRPAARPHDGYRRGPTDPTRGLPFDRDKVLLDPYGRGVAVPRNYSRAVAPGDNAATAMKTSRRPRRRLQGATSRRRPARAIVSEMHVRGFTRHPSSGVAEPKRGTFAGLIEKIP